MAEKLDYGVHLCYSKAAEKVIRAFLARRCAPEEGERLWQRTRDIYAGFLETMPDLGGRANYQAGSVYDCVALFALYEASERALTLEDMARLNDAIFLPPMEKRSFLNLNWPFAPRMAHKIFAFLAKRGKKHSWPGNYHMEVEPFNPAVGVRYKFHTCPIADFARAHGYTHLMPAFCNPDFPMLAALHGTLIRTQTCANGSCCDYWIVGSESEPAKKYPLVKDEAGFLVNVLPEEERW